MKCPKCSYIGFEATDRCRNCGYDFALAATTEPVVPDLAIRTADAPEGPLSDLSLGTRTVTPAHAARRAATAPSADLDRVIGEPAPAVGDLPLFAGQPSPAEDLPPLITPRATPRRPVAVRRPTPDPTRLRPRPPETVRRQTPAPELPLPDRAQSRAILPTPPARLAAPAAGGDAAPGPRLAAALIDLGLLLAIDALTLYFTLRLCGLTAGEWRLLPLLPLGLFLLILSGGYLVTFTAAGGQTIGKMALGLRVVAADDGRVPVGAAALRALGCIASTICLGAGLVPALIGPDRRAVHDRLADTRVVRAS
jgi:uncharacterized RDD family membrane protein YckC